MDRFDLTHRTETRSPDAMDVEPQHLDDGNLVDRVLQGDHQGWESLVDRYGCLIYSIARRCGLPSEDVADVFQSVLLNLLQDLESLRETKSLNSWIITVTLEQCHQIMRCGRNAVDSSNSTEDWRPTRDEILLMDRERLARQALLQIDEPARRLLLSAVFPDTSGSTLMTGQEAHFRPVRSHLVEAVRDFMSALRQVGYSIPS